MATDTGFFERYQRRFPDGVWPDDDEDDLIPLFVIDDIPNQVRRDALTYLLEAFAYTLADSQWHSEEECAKVRGRAPCLVGRQFSSVARL